jgi:hypothetical protein
VKAIRHTANETWATQNLTKLDKFNKQPLPIRYPAFSLKMDLTMGLLEGLISFVGYALMLAVNNIRLSHSAIKSVADRDFDL